MISKVRVLYLPYAAGKLEQAHSYPHSDAGYDMRSPESLVLEPGCSMSVNTGICLELPKDTPRWWFGRHYIWEAQIRPRSSMRKLGIIASLGTIDSGFRGEIGCILHNHSDVNYQIHRGDKICQLVITRMPKIKLVDVKKLGSTARGEGRYGSTGR